MAKFNIEDLTVKGNFAEVFANNIMQIGQTTAGANTYCLSPEDSIHVIKTIILGLSDNACLFKDKSKPTAVSIVDLKGNPLLSIKTEYAEGTKDNPEGSWEVAYVFGNEELDGVNIVTVDNVKTHTAFINRAAKIGFSFNNPSLIYAMLLAFANAVVTYLDQSASETEEVSAALEGYFEIKVVVIDGKKVMSLLIDEPLIKIVVGSDTETTLQA